MLEFDAVVLACGVGKRLLPLSGNSGVDCLLPVAMKPMLSYPIKNIQQTGASKVIVVVGGDHAASSVKSWMSKEYPPNAGLQYEVVSVPEGSGSADGLRAAVDHMQSDLVLVVGYNLITDVPLRAVLMSHYVDSSVATVMFKKRKRSAASETKPGKAPKDVDFVSLDASENRLLFYASSPGAIQDFRVPGSVLRSNPKLKLTTDLVDTQLCVFSRPVLSLLDVHPSWSDLQRDVLPYLIRHQFRKPLDNLQNVEKVPGTGTDESEGVVNSTAPALVDGKFRVSGFLVDSVEYCAQIASVQSFGDVNKELAAPELCSRFVGLTPSKQDNFVHSEVEMGNKTTVASACIVWAGTVLGDKTTVKRSLIGSNCRIGNGVKVINSVLLDNVTVGDNVHIQNCVIGSGSVVGVKAQLKDCQIGPEFKVNESSELKGEVLPPVVDDNRMMNSF